MMTMPSRKVGFPSTPDETLPFLAVFSDIFARHTMAGVAGDQSGWTLPAPSPLTEEQAESGAAATGHRKDGPFKPLHLAFSAQKVPPLRLHGKGQSATKAEDALHLPRSATERASPTKPLAAHLLRRINELANEEDRGRHQEYNQHSRQQTKDQEEGTADSSVFATDDMMSPASSPQTSFSKLMMDRSKEKMPAQDASGWTLPGARTPGMSMIAKGAPTPSGKDGQILVLRQLLEERDEEIANLKQAEHDLSMSLDRVVYELQTDIQVNTRTFCTVCCFVHKG